MSLKVPFICPVCQHKGRARLDLLGKPARCKECEARFLMPKHLRVPCPQCEEVLRVRSDLLDRRVICKQCDHYFMFQIGDVLTMTITRIGARAATIALPNHSLHVSPQFPPSEAPLPEPSDPEAAAFQAAFDAPAPTHSCTTVHEPPADTLDELAFRSRIFALESALAESIAESERLRAKLERHANLQMALDLAESEARRLRDQLQAIEDHRASLEGYLEQANRRLGDQASQLAQWTDLDAEILAVRQCLQDAQGRTTLLLAERSTLQASLNAAETERDCLAGDLHDLKARLASHGSHEEALVAELEAARAARDQIQAVLDMTREELRSFGERLEQTLHQLEHERARSAELHARLEAQTTELSSVETDLEDLRDDLSRKIEQIAAFETQHDQYLDELSKEAETRRSLSTQLDAMRAELADRIREAQELRQQHETARQAWERNQSRAADLQAALETDRNHQQARADDLDRRLASEQAERLRLQARLDEVQARTIALQEAQATTLAEADHLRQAHLQAESHRESLSLQIEALNRQLADANDRLARSEGTTPNPDPESLKTAQIAAREAHRIAESLRAERDRLLTERETMAAEQDQLRLLLDTAREDNQELRQRLEPLRRRLTQLEAAVVAGQAQSVSQASPAPLSSSVSSANPVDHIDLILNQLDPEDLQPWRRRRP